MKKIIAFIAVLALLVCGIFTLKKAGVKFVNPFQKQTTEKKVITGEQLERSDKGNFIYSDSQTYKEIYNYLSNGLDAYMPSTGDVKVLVVPISFSDVFTTEAQKIQYKSDLERAFFGNDTGFESLSSYYYKSSYGKLNISGEVLDWFTPTTTASQITTNYVNDEPTTDLIAKSIEEALAYYDETIDFTEYDYDKDGVIDGVYFVYNKKNSDNDSPWWAWTSKYKGPSYDNVKLRQFVWASFNSMYQDDLGFRTTGNNVNAITYIHETGHLMGADDYYDYSPNEYKASRSTLKLVKKGEGCNLGIGKYDMMASNVGDHNGVTKMFYGWIDPYVVTTDCTITVNKFSTTGDTIIVCPCWNDIDQNLSEYLVIEYYDNDGIQKPNIFDSRGYTTSGIIIYHVNAFIEKDNDYWSTFKYDNSYTEKAFITLVDAESHKKGKTDFIDSSVAATNKSLFQKGDVYTPIYSDQYNDLSLLDVTISIDDITPEYATISISIKGE